MTNTKCFWYIALFAVMVCRWFYRFMYAALWAEDGSIFLQQAFQHGVRSLIMPYAGYFHTVPRIIAYGASLLPTIIIPHFLVMCVFLLVYFIISRIFSDDYEWLIPGTFYRGIAALLFALTPGSTEVYGNMANIHSVLYLYVALLGLKKPGIPFKKHELVFIVLTVATEGATLTLLPLFCIRLFCAITGNYTKRIRFQELFTLLCIILFVIINYIMRSEGQGVKAQNFVILLKVYIKTTVCEFLAFPWLYDVLYKIQGKGYWLIAGFYVAMFAAVLLKKKWYPCGDTNDNLYSICVPIVFFMSVLLYIPMIAAVRSGSDHLFLTESWWLFMRYGFPAGFAGYLFWIWLLSSRELQTQGISRWASLTLLALSLIFCSFHFFHEPGKAKNLWFQHIPEINAARQNHNTGPKVTIPIEPGGWSISIGKCVIINK